MNGRYRIGPRMSIDAYRRAAHGNKAAVAYTFRMKILIRILIFCVGAYRRVACCTYRSSRETRVVTRVCRFNRISRAVSALTRRGRALRRRVSCVRGAYRLLCTERVPFSTVCVCDVRMH
jgi:hypothetical protein